MFQTQWFLFLHYSAQMLYIRYRLPWTQHGRDIHVGGITDVIHTYVFVEYSGFPLNQHKMD
jgi:hypothetical protein